MSAVSQPSTGCQISDLCGKIVRGFSMYMSIHISAVKDRCAKEVLQMEHFAV